MVLNLKEAGRRFRELVQSLRSSNEACEVRNEKGQMVAVVLPVERYRLYQQEWEKDFVAVDRIRDKMRDNDPDYVETQIVKKVVERDPEDDNIIIAAVEGKADCIVSGDRHLQDLDSYEDIPILSPSEFVARYNIQ